MNRTRFGGTLGSTFLPYYRRFNSASPARPQLGSTFLVTMPDAYKRPQGYTLVKGLGATASGGVTYEDFTFPDGYSFRQYDDGTITILKSPVSSGGQQVTKDNPKTAKAWAEITKDIEDAKIAKAAGKKIVIDPATRDAIIKAVGTGTGKIIRSAGKVTPAKKKSKKKTTAAGQPVEVPVEAPSNVPWIPIAVAGAGLLLVFALFSGGSSAPAPARAPEKT